MPRHTAASLLPSVTDMRHRSHRHSAVVNRFTSLLPPCDSGGMKPRTARQFAALNATMRIADAGWLLIEGPAYPQGQLKWPWFS
jgi:hypothetical protein